MTLSLNAGRLRSEMECELGRILDYWMRHAPDREHGGFFGEISNNNQPDNTAPKSAILNARILWTFSAALRLTGRTEYRETADRAYRFVRDRFLDREHGGVYWSLNPDGSVANDRKQIYAIAFAMYGMSEYFRATGEPEAKEIARSFFEVIEKYSFDPVHNGYLEALSRKWERMDDVRLSEKDENALKTMNTHLHILEAYTNLYRIWKDEHLAGQIRNLIGVFLQQIIQDDAHFGLFFDEKWRLNNRNVSFGHDIEGSWLLLEAAEVLDEKAWVEEVKSMALRMAEATLEEGLSEDGAVQEEFHVGRGILDTTRHWWPQAEGIVGFYNAFQVSGDTRFRDTALRIWEYTKTHLLDTENGEWFWRVDPVGVPAEQAPKVGFWKCPYHNGRACMEIMDRIAD